MSPVTKAGSRSSQSLAAIRLRRDAILPDADSWTPPALVPQPLPVDERAVFDFIEWAAFDEVAIEARAAKRLIVGMR